jgi:glycosyltransferase involved in cell wall biosynthesis
LPDRAVKVAIDYRPALFSHTGIARYVRELVRALASCGATADVHLFGAAWRRARTDLGPPPFPLTAPRIPGRLLPWLARLGCGADTLCGGAQIFHYTDVVFPEVRRARRLLTVHDLLFESLDRYHDEAFRRSISRRVRRALERADHVIAVSERTRRELMERHGLEPDRVTVVPLGCDHLDQVTPALVRRGDEARPYFLCVGTLEPRKNLTRVLRAFEIAAARGLPHRLVIAGGRGWMMRGFDDALGASPQRARVELLGAVSDGELVALYRGAEVLVYPSLQEGFGLPVAEALRLGVPVITSTETPMADLFGDAALVVCPRDVEAIADAMQRCALDATLRARLVSAGVAATRSLTWEHTATRTVEIYEQLARRNHRG